MRTWIATKLVKLAQWIQPNNPAVMQFWMDRMTDFIYTGQSNIKIEWVDVRPDWGPFP